MSWPRTDRALFIIGLDSSSLKVFLLDGQLRTWFFDRRREMNLVEPDPVVLVELYSQASLYTLFQIVHDIGTLQVTNY